MEQRRDTAMKRIVLTLALLCAALAVWPVRAQETPTFATLEIALWPEYDAPEMLVIYRGVLAADTVLPVPLEIRIPASIGQPTAVAYADESGQTFNQPYTTRVEGESLVVELELDSLGFQLEYYAPLTIDSAGQRSFTFDYTADHPVEDLRLEAQVPFAADGYALEPDSGASAQDAGSLTYYRVAAGSLVQGETRTWTITYANPGGVLTRDALAPASETQQTPAPAPVSQTEDNSTVIIFAIAFVVLVAVGGGAFWLGKQTQPAPEPAVSPQRKRRGSGRGATEREGRLSPVRGDQARFCFRCGADLRPDSEFCHKCGAEVRE